MDTEIFWSPEGISKLEKGGPLSLQRQTKPIYSQYFLEHVSSTVDLLRKGFCCWPSIEMGPIIIAVAHNTLQAWMMWGRGVSKPSIGPKTQKRTSKRLSKIPERLRLHQALHGRSLFSIPTILAAEHRTRPPNRAPTQSHLLFPTLKTSDPKRIFHSYQIIGLYSFLIVKHCWVYECQGNPKCSRPHSESIRT